jgi:murein L,D-transpeptidase YcbB/YkuD
VIGKNSSGRRSPEFSDEMEHMVINPTWHVPRSIVVGEYLPRMQRNPNAVSHLKLYTRDGREVNRGAVDFTAYSARTFPFSMKQPPSSRNALGLVKFMFPNTYNIYLHDTPEKALFDRETRAFSHGCIRLQQPFEFAYELLSRQEADPTGYFHSVLDTGRETHVRLDQHVPVHIIYRTAITHARGRTEYREDVYGRDGRIWEALKRAGVTLPAVQS